MKLDLLRAELHETGLNLFAVINSQSLAASDRPEDWRSLILVGNAGPGMWRTMPAGYRTRPNPVDDYARDTVDQLMAVHAADLRWKLLFPAGGAHCPPLQTLGRQAGWHANSPLGLGINERWGLWFAYRAVVAVSIDLEPTLSPATQSPCLSCQSQACVSACPGSAVSYGQSPDLLRCAGYRVQSESRCAESCVARLSCPVAVDHRYEESQMAHHYRLALPALTEWLDSQR